MESKRIAAIDVLRGLSIFMMILAGSLPWGCGLPAWMYHCQVPPVDFVFNPDIKGITWVDLVFPFFLFSMGAALPFSLRSRMDKGTSTFGLVVGILKRWVLLAAFGVVLGNAYAIKGAGAEVYKLAVWIGMFLAFWRVPKGSKIKPWLINLIGIAMVVGLMFGAYYIFGLRFSVERNNIIIMILSSMALVCGLIWLITKENRAARWILILLFAVLKDINWHFHCFDSIEAPSWLYWLINWRYLQYTVVTLIGSEIGDMILGATRQGDPLCFAGFAAGRRCNVRSAFASVIAFVVVPALVWAFFTRNILIGMAIVCVGALGYRYLTRDYPSPSTLIANLGFALLLLGVVMDPVDGGITKDHCNVCYMLSTSGMAALLTSFFLWWESVGKLPLGLSYTGQNPMIAYTVTGFVTGPFLYLIGLGVLDNLSLGHPVIGLVRGLVVTFVMMAFTCCMTKLKIFWRT